MKSLIALTLAIGLVALGDSSPVASPGNCTDFLQDAKFDEKALEGIWRLVHSWPPHPEEETADVLSGTVSVWFYPLTRGETVAYRKEMEASFPSLDWDGVNYSCNIDSNRERSLAPYGFSRNFRFLLEFTDESSGAVGAVPAGDTLNYMLRSRSPLATLRYRFKTVGEYLVVVVCDSKQAYLLHKGFDYPSEEDVRRMVSTVDVDRAKNN